MDASNREILRETLLFIEASRRGVAQAEERLAEAKRGYFESLALLARVRGQEPSPLLPRAASSPCRPPRTLFRPDFLST